MDCTNGEESFGEEITITSGGLYTVTATTTNGTGCTRTREIQVNESIVATINWFCIYHYGGSYCYVYWWFCRNYLLII